MSQMGEILLHDNLETCVQSYISNNGSITQLLLDRSVGGAIRGLVMMEETIYNIEKKLSRSV